MIGTNSAITGLFYLIAWLDLTVLLTFESHILDMTQNDAVHHPF